MLLTRKIIAVGCALLCTCLACHGDTGPERVFRWNEANALAVSAKDPADYLMAAQAYQALLDRGVRNGPVLYNLGTALLNAGDNANAVDTLLRAERYMGGSPDLARNLSIALARKSKGQEHHNSWQRIAFFWHFKCSAPARTATAASASLLFWVFLTAAKLGAGKWTRFPAMFCVLVFILFATSVATSLHQETNARRILPGLSAAPADAKSANSESDPPASHRIAAKT